MSQAPPVGSSVAAQIQEQVESNTSALPYADSFAGHRAHMTPLALDGAAADGSSRLCVLGAGNCYDIDLGRVVSAYREVHLVDIDRAALERVRDRLDRAERAKVFGHAPVDLSGMLDHLERWARMEVEHQELVEHSARASSRIIQGLPGPFDVVLSACVLSQIQFAVFNVLSSAHPLFDPVRHIANVTHLRTLAGLMTPNGRARLATDVASDDLYPLRNEDASGDLRPLLQQLVASGTIVYAVRPDLLAWMVREDAVLKRKVELSPPTDAWLWQNGPSRVFLVYAMELRPRGPIPTGARPLVT